MSRLFFLLCVWGFFLSQNLIAQDEQQELNADELNRQLDNPISRFWSLILQENASWWDGNAVPDTYFFNILNFQPSLPLPIGKSKMLLVRPVFPLISVPTFDNERKQNGLQNGFGDMSIFSMVGPDKKDGLIWGAGLSFLLPTASDPNLGAEQLSMGPALMIISIGKKWNGGFIFQHWSEIGGDKVGPFTNLTDFQYIIRKIIPGKAMSIGMGPSITIDWEKEPRNRLTFPIGLGLTKTIKWGKMPLKMRIEPQYSIIKPEDFGARWNLRIQVAPIIRNPLVSN